MKKCIDVIYLSLMIIMSFSIKGVSQNNPDDKAALVVLYQSSNGYTWLNKEHWLNDDINRLYPWISSGPYGVINDTLLLEINENTLRKFIR